MNSGIIYQIYYNHPQHGMIRYIGSTTRSLTTRYYNHVKAFERWVNGLGHTIAIYPFWQRYGIDSFLVEEIKEVRFDNRDELRQEEQRCMEAMANINAVRAHRTIHDKRNDSRQYYQNNRDQIRSNMRTKGNQRVMCECGLEYNYSGKTCHIRTNKHRQRMELISESNNNNQ